LRIYLKRNKKDKGGKIVSITLKDGDYVYSERWEGGFKNRIAEVKTLVGYYRERGESFNMTSEPRRITAWTDDLDVRALGGWQRVNAQSLVNNQVVEIYGQTFTVKIKSDKDLIEYIAFKWRR